MADTRTLLTVPEARARLRIGHTTLYRLLGDGSIRSILIGRRRLIPDDAITEYIAACELEAQYATSSRA